MKDMFRLFAAVVAVSLGCASAQVTCGNQQYVPNPLNCSTYYECSNGKPYLMPCPEGQDFNSNTLTCTDAVGAGCASPVTAATTTLATSNQTPKYYCPDVDGAGSYLYPNPLSCSSFYMCNGGSLEIFQCPQGLQYSVTERVCVYPSIAKCDLNNLPSFPYGPTTPATCQAATTQATPTAGPTPNYYCPEVDGATSYIYASPYSCSSYYMCSEGKLYLFHCSEGLEFSATDRICEFPRLAKCDLNHLPSYPSGPTQEPPVSNPTTAATSGPVPSYYCPEVDGAVNYIYPSPYSCSQYYMCATGKLYLFPCPSGLEYSVSNRVCVLPALAKCDLNHLPSYPTGPTQEQVVSNPTTPATVGPPPNYYCPEVDGATSYIYASPYSCSSYYMCSGGKLYLFQCSEGLDFSAKDRICEFPALAKCDLNNLPSYPTGPTPAQDVSNPTTAASIGPTPNYYCPEVDGANTYIYASPYSCSSYYMCAEGKLYLFECSAGLEFSATDRVCAFPALAKCDLNHLPSYPTGPTQEQVVSNPTTAATIRPPPNYYCPEVDGANTYIYPSPYSCSSYYMCAEGKLYLFECSVGLEFSVTDRVCAFPALAKCDLNHLPTYPTGPTEAVTSARPTSAVTTTPGPTPNFYCPIGNSTVTYLYPCPYSCSLYYMCVDGLLYLVECPSGLEYSTQYKVCLLPSLAMCDLANLPSYPTGHPPASTIPSATTPTDIAPVPSYYCPEVDTATAYRYPNPYSCSSYYQCIKGSLHLYQCPDGFEYSVSERDCDYANVARCDLSNLPSFPTGPTAAVIITTVPTPPLTTVPTPPPTTVPTPPPNTPTTSGNDATITVTYECPPNESGTYYRYPGDCHKFYECNYGVAEVQSCPANLFFSESKQDCLYPEQVPECQTSSSTSAAN